MKIAIIEYNDYHDEIFYSYYKTFEKLNIKYDFYTSNINKKRNIFYNIDKNIKIFTIRYIYNANFFSKILIKFFNYILNIYYIFKINLFYDYVIFNSIEPINIIKRSNFIFKNKIFLIHNACIINNNIFKKYYNPQNTKLICLADYISSYLYNYNYKCDVFYPYFLPEIYNNNIIKNDLLIQGNITFRRKNYNLIFNYLKKNYNTNIKFNFIGKSTSEITNIYEYARYYKIIDFLKFKSEMFYYKDYYDEIKKYSFILFLLDEEKIEYFPYFHYKYTSSLATAISFGIIPIVDQNTANIYKITDFSIIYHKYLDEAIDKISNMNENDYLNLKLKIFNFKNIYLNKNIKTFIKLLNLNHDFNNSHKEDCKC